MLHTVAAFHCSQHESNRPGQWLLPEWFHPASRLWERFTVHYTPKHGSWLNQAEIEIGLFSRQCLGKRRIGDIATLRRQAKACLAPTSSDFLQQRRIALTWH
jgi:hypothetical protein